MLNGELAADLYSAYCRPSLLALMEFAKNVLICRTRCKRQNPIRFSFLRSNLSCHHTFIYLRNLSTCYFSKVATAFLRGLYADVVPLICTTVRQQRPGSARHFVRQGHDHHVCRSSLREVLTPCALVPGPEQNCSRAVDQ